MILAFDSWLANMKWWRKWTAHYYWYLISETDDQRQPIGSPRWVRVKPIPATTIIYTKEIY